MTSWRPSCVLSPGSSQHDVIKIELKPLKIAKKMVSVRVGSRGRRASNMLGTLWNYYGDGNGNVKRATGLMAIGLMSKTATLHVHHTFLYISLQSLHNNDVKWPNFKFTWERDGKAINWTISVRTVVRSFSSAPTLIPFFNYLGLLE